MYFILLGLLYAGFTQATDCPDFWTSFGGSCYYFPDHHRSSFTEAENYCRQHHNSHLVHIDNEAENTFVKDFLKTFKDEPHWMGLTDEDIEGMYKWFDTDTVPDYTDWAQGQPDSAIGGNEDCVIFYDDDRYKWHDVPCTEHHDPVCELKKYLKLAGLGKSQSDSAIGGNEDCVIFYDGDGYTWHDVPCTEHHDPVCELKTESFGGSMEILGKK